MGAKWRVYAGLVVTLAMQEANHGSDLISSSCSSTAAFAALGIQLGSHFPSSEWGAFSSLLCAYTLKRFLSYLLSFLPPLCLCFLCLCLPNSVSLFFVPSLLLPALLSLRCRARWRWRRSSWMRSQRTRSSSVTTISCACVSKSL